MNALELYEILKKHKDDGKDLEKSQVCFDTEGQEFHCHFVDVEHAFFEEGVHTGFDLLALGQNAHGNTYGSMELLKYKYAMYFMIEHLEQVVDNMDEFQEKMKDFVDKALKE